MVEPQGSRRVFQGYTIALDLEDWAAGYEHEVVRHLGAAGVLPLTPAGDVLLVRQFRPAIRDHLVEIPAGLLDVEGEEPRVCAERELLEETGFQAEQIRPLGGYLASAGFTDEFVHLFLAHTFAEPSSEPEDGIKVLRRPFEEMVEEARSGLVRDVKTAMALLLAAGRLEP